MLSEPPRLPSNDSDLSEKLKLFKENKDKYDQLARESTWKHAVPIEEKIKYLYLLWL